jgi:hypothetical protein
VNSAALTFTLTDSLTPTAQTNVASFTMTITSYLVVLLRDRYTVACELLTVQLSDLR